MLASSWVGAALVIWTAAVDPADVPMIRSASVTSNPASNRPAMTPINHALPADPPPPRTNARSLATLGRVDIKRGHLFARGNQDVARHDARLDAGAEVDVRAEVTSHVDAHREIAYLDHEARHGSKKALSRDETGPVGTDLDGNVFRSEQRVRR